MDLYVGRSNEKDLKELKSIIKNLKVNCTSEELLKHGFTNRHKPTFYFCRILTGNNPYQISFSINISSKTLKIKSIEILDEQFCQPAPTTEKYNKLIKEYVDGFIEKGVFIREDK